LFILINILNLNLLLDIELNVKGCKTLSDSLKNYIQEEILEGDDKYEVEGHGLQVCYLIYLIFLFDVSSI
jgi:hypothetical protein